MQIDSAARITSYFFMTFIFGCSHLSIHNQAIPERKIVAKVFDQTIFADELEPSDESIESESSIRDPEELEKWKENCRLNNFFLDTYCMLECRYLNEQHIDLSEEDIWAWLCIDWKETKADLLNERSKLLSKLSEETISQLDADYCKQGIEYIEHRLADGRKFEKPLNEVKQEKLDDVAKTKVALASSAIRSWMFNKAIHAEYGGKVCNLRIEEDKSVLILIDFPEPIEAIAQWIREIEEKGELVIYDSNYKKLFFAVWNPLNRENVVDPPVNLFTIPPWHMEK